MQRSDQDLMGRIATGDQAAFAEVYDRYAARILGLLVRWLRQRGDADDVLQETFWHVWLHADQYDPARGILIAWLVQIARSRATDVLRRRHRIGVPPENGHPAATADAAVRMEWSESCRHVRAALAQLPEEQRTTIDLAFFGGLTHQQIAQCQDTPLGTVKTRIRLGMRRLGELLAPHWQEVIT